MARYKAEFNQLRTEAHFYIMVTVGNDSSSTPAELTLGGTPFVVSIVGDEMYKPVRYSKATMEVRTSDYLMNLYAAGAHDVKVVMRKNNSSGAVVWAGYATPNIYDMGFAYQRNTLQLELVDGLSTLQYYPYERSEGTVISFFEIINKCLQKAGVYSKFYFSSNTQKNPTGTSELLSTVYISESNFFDKKDDANETDADVAWTYKEVLEEICKYMGVTAVAVGDAVYFIDADAVGGADHYYYSYTVGGSPGNRVQKGTLHSIVATDFSGANSSISLGQIYNKVRVKDSLYDFDEVVPGLFEEGFLSNITALDQDGSFSRLIHPQDPATSWMITNQGTTQEGRQLKILTEDRSGAKFKNYARYLANSFYTLHQYVVSGNSLVESSEDWANYTRAVSVIGAYLVRMSVNGVSEYSQSPANVSFSDYLCIRWNTHDGDEGQGRADITADDIYPMIESDDTEPAVAFFGGENAYIILQGKVRCLAELVGFLPNNTRVQDKSHNNFGDRMWLPAMLKMGNYYWNGTQWTTTASKFKLYFSEADHLDTGNPHDTDGGLDADKFYNKDFSFRNTTTYEDGLDEEGYAIPLDGLPLTLARPKFVIYNPHHMVKDNYLDSVWISGLKIIAAIANPDNEDKDSDTEYVNVIANGSVAERKSESLKICTFDNKKPNYSAPAFYDGSSFAYVDKLYNRACQSGENSWESYDGETGSSGLRQEEHLIYRLVNQYSSPSVILKLPLRADVTPIDRYQYGSTGVTSGKTFVLTAATIDYKKNTSSVTLEEKK